MWIILVDYWYVINEHAFHKEKSWQWCEQSPSLLPEQQIKITSTFNSMQAAFSFSIHKIKQMALGSFIAVLRFACFVN